MTELPGGRVAVMRRSLWVSVVVSSVLGGALPAVGQTPVGALAIDERRGDQWGWAVDYESADAARARALRECGAGCTVVLTFARCGAYAADQDADSTAVGWGESYASAADAQRVALSECSARGGGSGCLVRAWGCNGPVVEEGLSLDREARRQVQLGLQAGGFDPGGADGLFGPRTRAAIRNWQTSRGARATGYLDGASAEALRTAGASGAPIAQVARPQPLVATAEPPQASPAVAPSPPTSAELEGLFWQSVMNSTNPAEFEAYLSQFPSGVFSALARARLAALASPTGAAAVAAGTRPGSASEAPGDRVPAASARSGEAAVASEVASGAARPRPGEVFRDCAECPAMVVLEGGRLALGRYEVTVGEYRVFTSATGRGVGAECLRGRDGDSWRNPGFPQTDRHPVTCVSWDDARKYVSWLSRTTRATYRLPTEDEWGRAAAGTPERSGCGFESDRQGTCPVGSYGANGTACPTWWGTCGNGPRTEPSALTNRGASWFVAVPGSTARRTSGPACAPCRAPGPGTGLSDFVLRGRWMSRDEGPSVVFENGTLR